MPADARELQDARYILFEKMGDLMEALCLLVDLEEQGDEEVWQWSREDHVTVQASVHGINELRFVVQSPADDVMVRLAAAEASGGN